MNIEKTMEFFEKYGKCPDCGSSTVGNGQGAIIVEEDTFARKCKCGFEITVDENNNNAVKCDYCGCKLDNDNKGSETTCIMCYQTFEAEFESEEE